MYLLDTNVVSELRKAASATADDNLVAWSSSVEAGSLYISSITLLELEIGVQRIERRDSRQGKVLRSWLSGKVGPAFSGRILPFDANSATICASYHVPDPSSDRDSFIAAIAKHHGMIVVTRNERDFASFDVSVINPWHDVR